MTSRVVGALQVHFDVGSGVPLLRPEVCMHGLLLSRGVIVLAAMFVIAAPLRADDAPKPPHGDGHNHDAKDHHRAMDPIAEAQKHQKRLEKIARLEAIAREHNRPELQAKAGALREKEQRRHEKAMARIARVGDAKDEHAADHDHREDDRGGRKDEHANDHGKGKPDDKSDKSDKSDKKDDKAKHEKKDDKDNKKNGHAAHKDGT